MIDFDALHVMAAKQNGVLTRHQLRDAGLSERQVTHRVKLGLFRRLPHGLVALAGTAPNWDQRATAAALAALPEGALSHRSASRKWGFRTVDEDVEISVRYPRRLSIAGAIVHRSVDLEDGDITWFNEIPITTRERTICDLGLIFPDSEVYRILVHEVAAGTVNRHDVRRLRRRIGRSGRDGAGVVGRCLDRLPDLAEQTESGVEALFLEVCRDHVIPEPIIQLGVVACSQHYRLDFAYPSQRVFVEIDGVATHSGTAQIAKDDFRQNNLVSCGWQPVRFTYDQLRDDPASCARILREILAF